MLLVCMYRAVQEDIVKWKHGCHLQDYADQCCASECQGCEGKVLVNAAAPCSERSIPDTEKPKDFHWAGVRERRAGSEKQKSDPLSAEILQRLQA